MLSILKAPYPLYTLNPRRILSILGIGLFVSLFLLYFQPFGTAEASFPNKKAFLLGYGLVISATMLLLEFLVFLLFFKTQKEEEWTVGKQFLWVAIYTSIALGTCYLYKQWFFQNAISFSDFGYFYKIAFTIAIFPIVIITLIDYIYQLQKNQALANSVNARSAKTEIVAPTTTNELLRLTAENGKDQIQFPLQGLHYIQAADNYAEVYFQEAGQAKKEIIRSSLQRIAQQITAQFPDALIHRCHRSFLVNLQKVSSVSGNAQGYKLHIGDGQTPVPVSRANAKSIRSLLENLNG